jgi:hypothetical protein
MSISVVCDQCGKRLNIRDELVGKKVKCPGCKTPFTASPGAGPAIRVRKQEKGPQAKVSISWGPVLLVALGILVVGGIAAIYFGPVRAKHAWDPMAADAESDVQDVLQRGLEVYLIENGLYDPTIDRQGPSVDEPHMLWDAMVMSLPEHVRFKGVTSEGEYTGTFNTKTQEVVAEVEIGGRVVPGMTEAVRKGDKTFKVNGTSKDGQLMVYVDGKRALLPSEKPGATQPTGRGRRGGIGLPGL